MNRRNFPTALIVTTIALIFLAGCSTLNRNKRGAAKSAPQKDLYAQVPVMLRAPADDAANDLQRAEARLKLADDEVRLAGLQEDMAELKKKRADLNRKLARIEVQKNKVAVTRKKREAIDQANLGDKARNIKKIASLKTKELSIESDAINTRADIATTDLEVEKLNRKIVLQTERVQRLRQ